MGINLNEDATCGVDIHLKKTRLIERRVKQSKKTLRAVLSPPIYSSRKAPPHETHLMCNVRSSIGDIAPRLGKDALVVIAIKKCVFCLAGRLCAWAPTSTNTIRLETCVLQNDDQATAVCALNWGARNSGLDGE